MAEYTYFIISPGYELDSYVQYKAAKGNYIKFGDQASVQKPDHAGLRGQYLTHNPDIGVAAIMNSTAFTGPYLGTRLKNYMVQLGLDPVGTTEWFSIKADAAWKLFVAMQQWDEKVLALTDEAKLKTLIQKFLS
jgi:hypothetical protein